MSFLLKDREFLRVKPFLEPITIIQFATWDFAERYEEHPIVVIEYMTARGAYVVLNESDLWNFMHIWRNVFHSTFKIGTRDLLSVLDEKQIEILISNSGGNIPEIDGPLR